MRVLVAEGGDALRRRADRHVDVRFEPTLAGDTRHGATVIAGRRARDVGDFSATFDEPRHGVADAENFERRQAEPRRLVFHHHVADPNRRGQRAQVMQWRRRS